jgi:hypothetical protein
LKADTIAWANRSSARQASFRGHGLRLFDGRHVKAFTMQRPDVVICSRRRSSLLGWTLARFATTVVYWVMDLYPDLPWRAA